MLSFGFVVSVIKDVVLALAAGTGAVVGILGLRTWRRELRGRTEYEQARRLVRAAFKLRNATSFARRRMIGGGEWPEGGPNTPAGLTDPGWIVRLREHVYTNRWRHVSEAASELEAEALEAEVLWGDKIHQLMEPLRRALVDLQISLEQFLGLREDDNSDEAVQTRARFLGKLDATDELTQALTRSISAIEEEMRAHLQR